MIDPYEGKPPKVMSGKALSGWQFKHKVTLRRWSIPQGLDRQLERRFGGPSLVEEVYGRPSVPYLARMRERLLAAPKRAVDVATALLAEEQFDLVWITLSACHIAGHWFLDPSRLPLDHSDQRTKAKLDATLGDAYAAVDEALSDILACLPPNTDLIVLSPSSIGSNASRAHLLPGMLKFSWQTFLRAGRGPRKTADRTAIKGNILEACYGQSAVVLSVKRMLKILGRTCSNGFSVSTLNL